MSVESRPGARSPGPSALRVQMLGPLTLSRDGGAITLPRSRKVRALFAYLSLAPHAVPRSQLCELLWDVPNDPRGELRWSLSKIRSLVDEPGRPRVESSGDAIRLDLTDCFVDAIEIARATEKGIGTLAPERQRMLAMLFNGDFLEGLEIDRSPTFTGWLTAQRRRFRGCHAALLEHLAGSVRDDDAFGYLEKWLELAPFDQRVHEILLTALARRGRIREGEEHLAAAGRLFEAEGLDVTSLREVWRGARAQADAAPRVQTAESALEAASSGRGAVAADAARRASIAVMPFVDRSSAAGARGGAADALAHDVITRLAKLRSLFVIAQGTVFALSERRVGPEEAGRMLNVDYVVSGSVRRQGKRLTVAVELSETRTARIVWAETFNHTMDDAFLVLDEIGNRIVASIASEIETIERNRAILRPPSSLDAWEAHHRGLWHMYRFNKADNERAQHFFKTAVRLDPTFARAYAGLSFTHWQNAFQGWSRKEPEIERAYAAAGQSLIVDDRDPAAHWAMGRALWLRGSHEQSVTELEQAIDLSPNFALGHYTLAFVHSQGGDPHAAIRSSDHSRNLSPFDPLLFAMLGARAMALVSLGRFEEAADWGAKAAARPNAHAHILAIAAYSLALAGRPDEARAHMAAIHKTLPQYGVEDFLTAFQFAPESAAFFRQGAKCIES
ncbi:MAG TPA: BTAD domain-containing putative transcriptional regulator [Xanthobacteraceae bacterium]|nr:BTAD domain-containing putative transcriptional regulator [Xanthobacteraceae bacterium]